MPDAFPSALIAYKNALHQTDGWRWIVDIDIDGTNGYTLCDGDQPVVYGGTTYNAYPFVIDEIAAESDGSLPQVGLVFASVDDAIATVLDAGGVLGRRIQIRRVNVGNLAFAVEAGLWEALDARLDYQTATLIVGPYPLFESPVPSIKQLRSRCQKVYGGTDCGYNTSLVNLIAATHPGFDTATCDYGYQTANGCAAHGANEAANGAAVRHPRRGGFFPGIPKGLRL